MLGNIDTILSIIGSILTIVVGSIGFYGVFKKDSSINASSGIEYSFKNFKQQNRSRNINSILSAFQAIMWIFIYITLYLAMYYMERQVFKVEAEMVIPFLIKLGSFHFAAIIFLYYILIPMSLTKKYKGKKKVFFLFFLCIVYLIMVVFVILFLGWKAFFLTNLIGIICIYFIIKKKYFQVSKLSKFLFDFYIGVHFLFFLGFSLLGYQLLTLKTDKFLELVKTFISNEVSWIIFFLLLMAIVSLVWFWYNNFYSKMANIAFIYYQEKDSKKIYIYRKEDNQFLCANKEYLQCERKEFDAKMGEIQSKIEKKKDWTDGNKKKELNKYIDRLKPYSNLVRIDKDSGKACFEGLNECIEKLQKCNGKLDKFDTTDIINKVDEMIMVFQEMTAIKFIPEDEVMKQTLYPVVEHYQQGFFKKL